MRAGDPGSPGAQRGGFPYGEYFPGKAGDLACMFFNSRRTKARAAGACQYAIDRWGVDSVIVLGSCGGVASQVKILDLVCATSTVQWDAVERMNPMIQPFLEETAVSADLSWLSLDDVGEPVVRPRVILIVTEYPAARDASLSIRQGSAGVQSSFSPRPEGLLQELLGGERDQALALLPPPATSIFCPHRP
jgi:hypothetical protein